MDTASGRIPRSGAEINGIAPMSYRRGVWTARRSVGPGGHRECAYGPVR
jgi:hypothetical protein